MPKLFKKSKKETVKFIIQVEMKPRWIPYFMSMLKCMEDYGNMGCSREVGLYADGDGDFHPKFKTNAKWHKVDPIKDDNGHRIYDAG